MLKPQTNTVIQQIFLAPLNLKTNTYRIFTGIYFYLFMYFGNTMLTLVLKNALFGFSLEKHIAFGENMFQLLSESQENIVSKILFTNLSKQKTFQNSTQGNDKTKK